MKKLRHLHHHKAVIIIALLGLVLTAWAAQVLYKKLGTDQSPKAAPIVVQTVQAKEASMPEVLDTIGLLSAVQELSIKNGVGAGKIQILVPSGTWVKAGTLLATLIGGPEVRAPFDGYLADWFVKTGELVAANAPLVDVVNTDNLTLTYKVPEQYAEKLELGQKIELTARAFPDKIFKGTVRFIAPMVDKKTFTILVKAEVDNAEQQLWPGMSTHVVHLFKENPHAIVIPESALKLTLEGYEVWTVKDSKIVRQPVTVGTHRHGRVQIIKGIHLNDTVIITRTDLLKEGLDATPKDWTGAW